MLMMPRTAMTTASPSRRVDDESSWLIWLCCSAANPSWSLTVTVGRSPIASSSIALARRWRVGAGLLVDE